MNPEQIETLSEEIISALEAGATIASVAVPEIAPLLVIGKAVDKLIPGLAANIAKWTAGTPPTEEEKLELKKKLAILADPNNP